MSREVSSASLADELAKVLCGAVDASPYLELRIWFDAFGGEFVVEANQPTALTVGTMSRADGVKVLSSLRLAVRRSRARASARPSVSQGASPVPVPAPVSIRPGGEVTP